MRDIDPDSEENQAAQRQNDREIFALQMQAREDAKPKPEPCPDCGGQGWYVVPIGIFGDSEQQQCQCLAERDDP